MQEFIIEIVKSDEIYRKIANASLEKKDDIYRYDFMKKFEKKWDMYHCPLKAKQSGGYDVVMASGMLGYLLPQKIGDTEQKYIAELADEKLWTDCVASIENSLMTFVRHGIDLKVKQLLLAMENEFPNCRYELFTSTKSISNIRLYESLGYKIFKEEAVSEELQFVYLEKC